MGRMFAVKSLFAIARITIWRMRRHVSFAIETKYIKSHDLMKPCVGHKTISDTIAPLFLIFRVFAFFKSKYFELVVKLFNFAKITQALSSAS